QFRSQVDARDTLRLAPLQTRHRQPARLPLPQRVRDPRVGAAVQRLRGWAASLPAVRGQARRKSCGSGNPKRPPGNRPRVGAGRSARAELSSVVPPPARLAFPRSLRRPSDPRLGSRTPSPRTVRWRTPAARTRSALPAESPLPLAPFVRFSVILDNDFYSPVQGAALWCVVGRNWAGCAITLGLDPFDGNAAVGQEVDGRFRSPLGKLLIAIGRALRVGVAF